MSTQSSGAMSLVDPSTAKSLWLRWLPTFLGFPEGGLIATAVTGPVTSLTTALVGGAVAGAVLGAAHSLALRGRLPNTEWWIPATAVGQAVGLTAGATLVGMLYRSPGPGHPRRPSPALEWASCRRSSCVRTSPPGSGGRSPAAVVGAGLDRDDGRRNRSGGPALHELRRQRRHCRHGPEWSPPRAAAPRPAPER